MAEYLAWVAFVSMLVPLTVRRYGRAAVLAAQLACFSWLAFQAAMIGFDVKPGWVFPMFVVGLLSALPVALLCGLPFMAWRNAGAERGPAMHAEARPKT